MPGDVRNDLYVILEKGEFERGGRSSGKNIEVTVLILDCDRNILSVSCLLKSVARVKGLLNWVSFLELYLRIISIRGRF